uniref:Uncharacterized protein n=1 Tax=Peronospora matthiolae TaxID=2874970 RepID=A0AAV1UBS5_9STRA
MWTFTVGSLIGRVWDGREVRGLNGTSVHIVMQLPLSTWHDVPTTSVCRFEILCSKVHLLLLTRLSVGGKLVTLRTRALQSDGDEGDATEGRRPHWQILVGPNSNRKEQLGRGDVGVKSYAAGRSRRGNVSTCLRTQVVEQSSLPRYQLWYSRPVTCSTVVEE